MPDGKQTLLIINTLRAKTVSVFNEGVCSFTEYQKTIRLNNIVITNMSFRHIIIQCLETNNGDRTKSRVKRSTVIKYYSEYFRE